MRSDKEEAPRNALEPIPAAETSDPPPTTAAAVPAAIAAELKSGKPLSPVTYDGMLIQIDLVRDAAGATFQQNGMNVKAVFHPAIRYGSIVKVKSSLQLPLTPNGNWQVYGITYSLDTLQPRGQWFMELYLCPPGYVTVPPL